MRVSFELGEHSSLMDLDLRRLQTSLYALITASEAAKGVGKAGDLASEGPEALIRGDQRLSTIERVDIYANGYFYRLLECLNEEFPATLAVVGSDNFSALVRDYLLVWPPAEPSIFYAGRYLPEFISNHSLVKRWPFVADLAKLERTLLEVFHAADAPVLREECMRAIPAHQWSSVKLETHPAVQILHNKWRVTEILNAVESGAEWNHPQHQQITVLVWRQSAQVNYRDVDHVESRALELMSRGARFADICEVIRGCAEGLDQVALIGRLLARWLNDGVILGAEG
jgi:Putative DNA-binding domain